MGDGGVNKPQAITFTAAVQKVQTLVDSGLRVTLDLPETAIEPATMLMACKIDGVYLDITAIAHSKIGENGTKSSGRTAAKKRKQ